MRRRNQPEVRHCNGGSLPMARKRPRGMRLDSAAHILYTPTMHGKPIAVARWHHHIHLIPGWLFKFICDRFEASVWRGLPGDDFYEDDEPVEKIIAAFDQGVRGVTAKPYCPHVTYSSLPSLTCGCGLPIANITTGTTRGG